MTNKIILHIPHASTFFPFKDGFLVNSDFLEKEILKLTDWYTDELFYSESDEMVIAPFSRIFCDVERFEDDNEEVMAKFGMGVLYEKSDDGKTIRMVTQELRDRILNEYYWKHHNELNNKIGKVSEQNKITIIDCHSFPSVPFYRDLDQRPDRPDFNIGTDGFHTPAKWVRLAKEFFDKKGFTTGIDAPYRGALVPLKYYKQNKNVQSIMLEVNRKLYLKEPTNEKSDNFLRIKEVVSDFIQLIKKEG